MKHHHRHALVSDEANDKLDARKARVEVPKKQTSNKRETSEASKEGTPSLIMDECGIYCKPSPVAPVEVTQQN